ncbi:DoxX family protein [Micromonospora zhanjiangensis]
MTRRMMGRTPSAESDDENSGRSRRRILTYWIVTAVVVGECAVGGAMDLFRMAPFYPTMIDLEYPGYLATILGGAKLLAAVVLLAPRLPRLKEWAYAGVMINMLGACASHLAMHRPVGNLVPPAAFAALALLSWASRPPSRRLPSARR